MLYYHYYKGREPDATKAPQLKRCAIESLDPESCGLLLHSPEARDEFPRPGDAEGPAQAKHPLTRLDHAESRLAGREHDQLHAAKVEGDDPLRGEDAVPPGRPRSVCWRPRA